MSEKVSVITADRVIKRGVAAICVEVSELIVERYGGDTYMVWAYLMCQPSDYEIIKAVICKDLRIGQKRFQRAMSNLAEIHMAWLAPGQRLSDGSLMGKRWHVRATPRNAMWLVK